MKKALVVIDAQNDFIKGDMRVKNAEEIREKVYKKCTEAVKSSVDLFFTKDCHGEDYNSLSEAKLYDKHCLYGTDGQRIDEKISEFSDIAMEIIDKGTMGSLNLARALTERKYDEIEVIGFVLEKCVFANAVMLKATDLRAEVVVDVSCSAVLDGSKANKIIEAMEDFGISVINKNNSSAKSKKVEEVKIKKNIKAKKNIDEKEIIKSEEPVKAEKKVKTSKSKKAAKAKKSKAKK